MIGHYLNQKKGPYWSLVSLKYFFLKFVEYFILKSFVLSKVIVVNSSLKLSYAEPLLLRSKEYKNSTLVLEKSGHYLMIRHQLDPIFRTSLKYMFKHTCTCL